MAQQGLFNQLASVLATGNSALVREIPDGLPAIIRSRVSTRARESPAGALIEAGSDALSGVLQEIARAPGPLLLSQAARPGGYNTDWLLEEVVTSTDTTAGGGNVSLMMIDGES